MKRRGTKALKEKIRREWVKQNKMVRWRWWSDQEGWWWGDGNGKSVHLEKETKRKEKTKQDKKKTKKEINKSRLTHDHILNNVNIEKESYISF